MCDFQNVFDAALARVDSMIVEVVGISVQFTFGTQHDGEVHGVFGDSEPLGSASNGICTGGSNLSSFVLTDTVCTAWRSDMLTTNGGMFWADRVPSGDGGSCCLRLNRGQPPVTSRRR